LLLHWVLHSLLLPRADMPPPGTSASISYAGTTCAWTSYVTMRDRAVRHGAPACHLRLTSLVAYPRAVGHT
jgi:hypothetical protein